MTNEERIAANAAKGYIQVYEGDGWEIYKKLNEVGGWTYYSNRIGYEGAYPIWDTAVNDKEELRAILEDLTKADQKQTLIDLLNMPEDTTPQGMPLPTDEPFIHSWITQPGLEELRKPNVPERIQTLLELNAMIGRMQEYINKKLEQ